MIEYELFYLIGESKNADLPRVNSNVEQIITANGGMFLEPRTEENRKLAYKIENETRGTYIARRFTLPDKDERDANGAEGKEHSLTVINKALQLSPDVLRFLILSAKGLPELKQIERVERHKAENKIGRYEKRGAVRPLPQAPVAPKETAAPVSDERIDEQLKEKLDI